MAYCSINPKTLNDLAASICSQIDEFLGNLKNETLNDLETQYGYEDTCVILERVENNLRKSSSQDNDNEFKANQVKVIRLKLSDVLFKSPEHVIPELNFNSKEANTSLITATRQKNKDGKEIKVEESIISADISQYLVTTLRQQLTRLSIIDLNSDNPRLIRTDSDLTNSIKSWRNSLLNILENYLESKGMIIPHIADMTPEEKCEYEKSLMIKAWSFMQNDLKKTSEYKFTAAQDSVGIKTVINPIMALAVLNNFDKVIESMSQDSIVINPKFKYKQQIYDNKYSFSKQSIQNSSFEGDFSDAAYTRIFANTLKRIFETIPDGHGGYCTVYDLNAIAKHIQTIASLKDNISDKNFEQLFSNENTPEQRFQALINILTNTQWGGTETRKEITSEFYKRYKDPLKLGSIAEYLIKISTAFNNSLTPNNTVEDEKQLYTQLNVQDQIVSMTKNAQNLAYFRVGENGADVNTASGIRKNKTVSRYKLENSLQRNIFDRGYLPHIYNAKYIIPGSSDTVLSYQDIFSKEFLDHIKELTGIDLRTPVIQSFMKENPAECANIIGRFLDSYKRLVTKYFKGKKFTSLDAFEITRDMMFNEMLGGENSSAAQAYVEFTDLISIENSQDDSMLYDQSLHAQPTQGTPTTIGKWVQNQFTWTKQRDRILDEIDEDIDDCNIFMRWKGQLRSNTFGRQFNRNLLSDVFVFRQDALVGNKNNRRVIPAYSMEAEELMTQAFNYEFLQPLLTDGIAYAQVDCVSDKIRTPLGALNANTLIPIETDGKIVNKAFKDLSNNELIDIYHDQHRSYYKVIEGKLIYDYNKLFNALGLTGDYSTLYNCVKQLEQLTENQLYQATRKIFKEGGYIELKPQVHFSGTGADGKLRFNNTLYYHIAAANDKDLFKKIVKSGIEETKKEYIKEKISLKIDLKPYQLAKFLGFESKNGISDSTGRIVKSDWDSVCEKYINNAKKSLYVTNNLDKNISEKYNEIFDRLISKFVIMQNLSAEADLQLSGKLEWIHKGLKTQKSIEEMNSKLDEISQTNSENIQALENVLLDFHKDQSARLVVSKKRYNSLVATYEPATPGGKFSVGTTQRIAYVKPHTITLYNQNGDPEHKQATNDGAIFGNGIFDIIESWSYPGKIYSPNSQKIIGIIPEFDTVSQIKTAKYSINNERIRNSFRQSEMNDKNHYDFQLVFKKMNNYQLDPDWALKWIQNQKQLSKNKIWYLFNGVKAYFNESELQINENNHNIIIPTWTTVDGENIDINTVAQCLGLNVVNGGFEINTVYDLWKLFGAQDSCSINSNGELVPSEISMEMTALAICEFSPNVKEKVIAKLIDIESAKSGQVNVNSAQDTLDENFDLLYQVVDSDRFGIQQDYTHEMIDSDIPLLTQALSGAALNGRNPEIAQIIYDELADIVDDSIQSVENYFGTEEQRIKFKNKLVEELAKSLKRSSASTAADEIVKETLENIKVWISAQKQGDNSVEYKSLPFSDRNIFSKVTSDMLVNLNASGIRQRFEGIAVIQNPSHGVIGVYEDINGNVLTRQDLLNRATELGITGTSDQKIDAILSREDLGFGLQKISSVSEVTIGDVVRIGSDENSEQFIIESPLELWKLENIIKFGNEQVFINRSVKRDLRTRQISFVDSETNEVKNLWNLRSTKFRLIVSGEKLKTNQTINKENVRIYDPEAISEFEEYQIGDIKSLAYMRANYEGLYAKIPYYYPTYSDFISDRKVLVTNVKTVAGEQIIPNVNRDRQGINHSLFTVKNAKRTIEGNLGTETHHTYFEDVIKRRLLKVNKLFLNKSGKSILSKDEFQATLTTNDSEIVITNHNLEYGIELDAIESNGEYWLPDDKGDLLFKVKEGKYKLQIENLENGKKLYAIQVIGNNNNKLIDEQKKSNYIINQIKDVNLYYNDWNYNSIIYKNRLNGISFDPSKQNLFDWNNKTKYDYFKLSELDKYIRNEAEAMYNSFLLTLNTISTRIPSQSWQSFLATFTVAFTENDSNDGYMNIWEMWMQGSDFDIDKAYTMMYALDKSGKIAGNGFIDYSSYESIVSTLNTKLEKPVRNVQFEPQFGTTSIQNPRISDEENVIYWDANKTISVNGKELTVGEVDTKKYLSRSVNGKTEIYIDPESNHRPSIDEYLREHPEDKIAVYNTILNEIRGQKGIVAVNTSAWSKFKKLNTSKNPVFLSYKWMLDINKYNQSNIITYKQNKIMQRMWEVTSGIGNFEAATKPMDSALVNDQMDEINDENGFEKKIYNGYSPVTKFRIQRENSVGKENVGINANGIKALAGLEQYYNIKNLRKEKIFTPNIDLSFKTSKDKGSRDIGKFKLTKIANTVSSEDQFINKLRDVYGEDLSRIKENPLIRGIEIINQFKNTRNEIDKLNIALNNKDLFIFTKDSLGNIVKAIPLKLYSKASEVYELYLQINPQQFGRNEYETIAKFLYYYCKFEDNAADILSVFISLSTDNAKELRLAMMNATPELMSIPIALVTYGMDLRSVLDMCMNTLGPIVKVMSANRFNQDFPKKIKVTEAIEECRKSKMLDPETCNSLQKVVALTSELRYLTSLYKINQGASTDLIELQRWIGNLKNVKFEKEKLEVQLESGHTINDLITDIIISIQNKTKPRNYDELVKRCALTSQVTPEAEVRFAEAISVAFDQHGNSLPIDFNLLFRNSEEGKNYRRKLVDYFNIISVGHNVIDVVLNSASFRSQLRATTRQLDVFNSMICTSAISQMLINKDIQRSTDSFKSLTSKESDNRTKMLFGHLSVGEFIKRLSNFTFVNRDIDSAFATQLGISGDPDSSFDLSTNIGVKNFMEIVHDQVIPYLKQIYDDNFFIRSLVDKVNRGTETIYTTLPFNAFAGKDQQIERSNIAEAKIAFARIMKNNSGLKNKDGKNISIGEVFYVYNMISTAGGMNAMKTCVEQVGQYSDLPSIYEDVVREFDAATEKVNGDLSKLSEQDIINNNVIEKLSIINDAINNQFRITLPDGNTSLSLKKEWIFTFANQIKTLDLSTIQEKLKEEFPSVDKIIFNIPDSNNEQLMIPYTVKFKYTIGNNTIEDKVNGYVYCDRPKSVDKYSLTGYELENIRYVIQSKIKYAEDFIDPNFTGELIEIYDLKRSFENNEIIENLKSNVPNNLTNRIIKSLPDNLKIKIVKVNSLTGENVNPHILQMNGEFCLVVPNLYDLNINSPEFINCLLTIKSQQTSQTQNLIELLKLVLDPKKYPNIERHNYKAYLRKIINDNDSVELYKLISPYVSWAMEESLNPSFNQEVQTQLELFECVFNENTRDFYFDKLVDNTNISEEKKQKLIEENTTSLQIGDIFDIDGIKYLYTCRTTSGMYILAPLTDPNANIRYSLVDPSKLYLKEYMKKRSPNNILGQVNKNQFAYNALPDQNKKLFEELGIGDLLIIRNQEYIVSDIIINRNGEEEIIIQNTKSEVFDLLKSEYYSVVKQTKTALINPVTTNVDFNEFDNDFPITIEIIQSLIPGDRISFIGKDNTIFQKLIPVIDNDGKNTFKILVSDGNRSYQYDPKNVTKIISHKKIIDDQFNSQTQPLTFYESESNKRDFKYRDNYKNIIWDTEIGNLRDIATGQLKKGYKKYVAKIGTNPVYSLTGYYLAQQTIPSVNDIVEINDNGIIKLMKIQDIKGTKLFGIVQTPGESSQTYRVIDQAICTKIYKRIPLTGKFTDRYYTSENPDNKLSNYHKGKRVLEVLSERYGMDITLENVDSSDPNSRHFAFVKDGKIIINTNKFNDYNKHLRENGQKEISFNEYVMLKGIHEFTHLVIAGIQAKDGNNYYQLMNYVRYVIQKNGKNDPVWQEVLAGGEIYSGSNPNEISDAQAQEYLVITIENGFRTNSETFLDNMITDNGIIEGIKSIMNAGFKRFTGGALSTISRNKQLKDVFLDFQRDVFGYATEDMNIEFIKRNYLESQYVDKIKCF